VSVLDTNGCTYIKSITVLEPDTLRWSITSTDVSCYGGTDGTADLLIWGGTASYNQIWSDSNGVYATTEDLSTAHAGDYTVEIKDKNLCTVYGDVYIVQPDSITIEDTTYTTTCVDNDDGKIEIYVSGGISGYSYLWSNLETTQHIYDLSAGQYFVDVTDANGCHQYDTLMVNISYEDCLDPPSAFTPDGDGYNDTWILQNIENYEGAKIKVFNKWGKIIFESGHEYTPWDGTYEGKMLPAATYYYIIDLNREEGKPYTGPVTIVKKK
jgi:gliding motility-associated-like protein